jgi:hypothetical protein
MISTSKKRGKTNPVTSESNIDALNGAISRLSKKNQSTKYWEVNITQWEKNNWDRIIYWDLNKPK